MSVSDSRGSLKSPPRHGEAPSLKRRTGEFKSVIWSQTRESEVSFASRILNVPILPSLCFLLVLMAAGWNTVDPSMGPKTAEEEVGLDIPVAIKLAIAAACSLVGVWGVFRSSVVRRSLFSIPGACLLVMSSMFLVAALAAHPESATVALVAALVNFGYLLFVPTVISVLGFRKLMVAMLIALVAYLIAAWFIFIAIPEMGVFEEDLGDQTLISRMGGLGHPNSVARAGIWAALLGIGVARSGISVQFNRILPLIIALSVLTVFETLSRTAMLAGAMAGVVMLYDRVFSRNGLTLALTSVALILCIAIAALAYSGDDAISRKLLSLGTKTGEFEELSSATGRTEIWTETIRLISQRPSIGYGLNSAPMLLEEYSQHAHNLVLHVMLSGGLIAGICAIALLLWTLVHGLPSSIPMIRGVSAFILVSGIFEDTAVDTFASPTMLLWTAILLYPSIAGISRVERSPIEMKVDSSYNTVPN